MTCRLCRFFVVALLCVAGCAPKSEKPFDRPSLAPVSFAQLEGWEKDRHEEALGAFLKSCTVLEKKEDSNQWKSLCSKARQQEYMNSVQARDFFENNFTPYAHSTNSNGLFTGYFEAHLRGAWQRGGKYQTPLWSHPDDLLSIDLGDFRDSLKGQKLTGKIKGHKFIPYDNRAMIARGSLVERAKPLLWVDDPVAAFFLEIQGSGQVEFDDGSVIRVGYAAQNGHGYTPVGRVLLDRGELDRPVTMQKIREWMNQNPTRAQEVMNTNPSYVFFKKSDKDGAVGAQGVVLTPMRSLAVDTAFVPLGTPIWLSTSEHKRLVIAQDTGGAIKGAVRGDLFWGSGPDAENGAGEMQNTGTYVLLLPKMMGPP